MDKVQIGIAVTGGVILGGGLLWVGMWIWAARDMSKWW